MNAGVRLWDRDNPNRCSCTTAYQPVLNAHGKLVKSRDPAWRMKEQVSGKDCMQEIMRSMSAAYRSRYQHHKRSDGSGAGYPDCHFWVPLRSHHPDGAWYGGSRYAELKRMGHDPTPAQRDVMASLQDSTPGAHVYLFRACCVFTGAVDAMFADLTGRPNLNMRGGRAFPPVEIPADAPVQPGRARRDPPVRRKYTPPAGPIEPPAPGDDPQPFDPAVGFVIPAPTDALSSSAMFTVEVWLRRHGFSPVDVPYPLRIIVGEQVTHVHCRTNWARPGGAVRVWRQAALVVGFPDELLPVLRADVVTTGGGSASIADMITAARPSITF